MFSEVYMLVNVTTYEVLVCPPHMCNRFPRRGSSLWYLQGASWVPRTAENGRMVLILYGTWVDGCIPLFEKSNAQEVHLVLLVQTTHKVFWYDRK